MKGIDSQIRTSTSTSLLLPSLVPAKELSFHDTIAGTASKSSLFRQRCLTPAEQNSYPSLKSALAASTIHSKPNSVKTKLNERRKRKKSSPPTSTLTEVTTVQELNRYWPRCLDEGEEPDDDEECMMPEDERIDPSRPLDYHKLLRGISVKGDTQIIGSKDHPEFVHPVIQLMHERKRQQSQEQKSNDENVSKPRTSNTKKEKIALVVEGGGMRGCVSAGMVCAIHCLGLSDTIDVVYGSSAGAVIAAYFVSKQLPYFGPEAYYDCLTTMENETGTNFKREKAGKYKGNQSKENFKDSSKPQPNHSVDRYWNDYFIDFKRMTRSMGLGLCDPRLFKDVWTRRVHGKPVMNLHYMFQNIMLKRKPLDYETFMERQSSQPLKIVATGLSSEKPFVFTQEDGHFDTIEDLCNSLHASCLLPGIAGPVMNVLKKIRRNDGTKASTTTSKTPDQLPSCSNKKQSQSSDNKPNFFLRSINRNKNENDGDYEPLGDAMLSAPIPYDIAHEEGATHVLVIRSSSDGYNLMAVPTIMQWIFSKISKRYFLKKNHLPSMYKRAETEQRHQRIYAKSILELNERANFPPPPDSDADQTMAIALEPGSEEISHFETTREGIFKGVRQGFARAYDALVEDPRMRGRGEEMALWYFPDEILDYDPNDPLISTLSTDDASGFQSFFDEYLSSTGIVPKTW
eukprot:CAMPEP_0197180954 /NCGR_PEP_ID=MMETSP1423-20130617/5381_1 /TAXON_ID=476441 /ORGANISM="Pseudo-nitzschia heimii, Strain UNC1101" /LENGTH=684 /DNA_ID=CAMNT_0042631103 /DNA_START=380 /DNA_END=2431 /DNA_ORIENTATION=-